MRMNNIISNKPKQFVRILLLCLVSVFIGLNIYLFNAQSILGNSLPMPFGYGAAVVLSESMEPELSKNDLIIVEETKNLAIGDVVVYQDGNILIVHRIVDIDKDYIQTKGDANNGLDMPINKEKVKGKVIQTIPFIGLLVNLLKSPIGIICVLVLAFYLLEMSYKKEAHMKKQNLNKVRDEIEKLKKELVNED